MWRIWCYVREELDSHFESACTCGWSMHALPRTKREYVNSNSVWRGLETSAEPKQEWQTGVGKKWSSRSEPNVIKIVMGWWLSMSNTNTSYLIGGVKEFTTASIHSIQFQLLPHLYYVTYIMDQSSNTWSPTDQKRFRAGLKWTVFDNDPMNQTEPTSNFGRKETTHAHLTGCDMTSN